MVERNKLFHEDREVSKNAAEALQQLMAEARILGGEDSFSEKQWHILEAALKVFSEKGFNGATTAEIAREAGIAEGTIFRHFRSKKDLLLALVVPTFINLVAPRVIDQLVKLIDSMQREGATTKEIIRAVVRDRLKLLRRVFPLMQLMITEMQYHPEIRDQIFNQLTFKQKDVFARFYRQGVEAGELQDLEPWAVMRNLGGMLFLYNFWSSISRSEWRVLSEEEELDIIVDMFLYGVTKRPEEP